MRALRSLSCPASLFGASICHAALSQVIVSRKGKEGGELFQEDSTAKPLRAVSPRRGQEAMPCPTFSRLSPTTAGSLAIEELSC